jgi:hypothetical protein
MVRWTDGSLCTLPSPVRCHQCMPERTPDHFLMRKMWFMRHLSVVDRYACACRFQIEHHVAWGIDRSKIFHVPTGQLNRAPAVLPPAPEGPKNRFGFFGQLIDAKGVHIILRAVRILRDRGFTDFTIELNGDNLRVATPAIRQEIETFLAKKNSARPHSATCSITAPITSTRSAGACCALIGALSRRFGGNRSGWSLPRHGCSSAR